MKAKAQFGMKFLTKIIITKYFGNELDIPTLVCCRDEPIVLGKPRFPHEFTANTYRVALIDNGYGMLTIRVTDVLYYFV